MGSGHGPRRPMGSTQIDASVPLLPRRHTLTCLWSFPFRDLKPENILLDDHGTSGPARKGLGRASHLGPAGGRRQAERRTHSVSSALGARGRHCGSGEGERALSEGSRISENSDSHTPRLIFRVCEVETMGPASPASWGGGEARQDGSSGSCFVSCGQP